MIGLKEAHKTFIENLKEKGKSYSTFIAYSKDIEQLINYLKDQGIILVSEIQTKHLQEFVQNLEKKSYTSKSVSRKINATNTFCKFLYDKKHITIALSNKIKHPKIYSKAPRILSKIEYRALRDASKNDFRSYAIIEVLLQTGITISEVSEIKMEHLEFTQNGGNLFVPKKNNKDARNIPLNKTVSQIIQRYVLENRKNFEHSLHLFITKNGKNLLIRNIRSTIDKYFKLAGIENAKVNDLRHTFIAHHLTQGVSIFILSKISGHKRLSTIENYLQYIKRSDGIEKTELGIL